MPTGYCLTIKSQKLTDGSRVYNVHISDSGAEPLIVECRSEDDAHHFAEFVCTALRRYTNDGAIIHLAP